MTLQPDDPRRKGFVRILRKARRRIKIGYSHFVCVALAQVETDLDRSEPLREWIMTAISPHENVGEWLQHRHRVPLRITDEGIVCDDRMREYRIAWIDHMIVYFGERS